MFDLKSSSWANFGKSLLNLFLQSNCPLCNRSTPEQLCLYCTRQLLNCQLPEKESLWQGTLPVFAWGIYSGLLKRAIAALKYDSKPEIGDFLGRRLGEAWLLRSPQPQSQFIVVPIPLHANKEKTRGYNQANLIAQGFCSVTGLKLKSNGLLRVRDTDALFGLSKGDRQKSLKGAFSLGSDFHRPTQQSVLLLDDIYTTGATAKSAIETLHQGGITVAGLAAIAISKVNKDFMGNTYPRKL